jgi:hypothetical protein
MKIVTVGNAEGHYTLICNVKADGCITPERNKNYLLFNKDTRWKMPGAKDFLTLSCNSRFPKFNKFAAICENAAIQEHDYVMRLWHWKACIWDTKAPKFTADQLQAINKLGLRLYEAQL